MFDSGEGSRMSGPISRWNLAWFILILGVAFVVTVGGLRATSGDERQTGIAAQVDGTAYRPYVYRQLIPRLVRVLMAPLPREVWTRMAQKILNSGAVARFEYATACHYEWWDAKTLVPIGLSAIITFLCLIGYQVAIRALLQHELVAPRAFFAVVPLALCYGLLFLNRGGTLSYDYPQVFLFALGILLLAKDKLTLFYLVYILGMINKETSVLLAIVFAVVYRGRLDTLKYIAHLTALTVIFLIIKLTLQYVYAGNLGHPLYHHVCDHNIAFMLDPKSASEIISLTLLIIGLAVRNWRSKPLILRQASVVLWPLFILTFLFGWIDEVRDLIEVFPSGLALAAISVGQDILGWNITSRHT